MLTRPLIVTALSSLYSAFQSFMTPLSHDLVDDAEDIAEENPGRSEEED
jgi:hypothetical protein